MEKLSEYKNIVLDGLMTTGMTIAKAILILLFGWIFIKIVLLVLKKALKFIKIDKLGEKLNEIELFEGKKLNVNVTKVILSIVKWSLLILLIPPCLQLHQWLLEGSLPKIRTPLFYGISSLGVLAVCR